MSPAPAAQNLGRGPSTLGCSKRACPGALCPLSRGTREGWGGAAAEVLRAPPGCLQPAAERELKDRGASRTGRCVCPPAQTGAECGGPELVGGSQAPGGRCGVGSPWEEVATPCGAQLQGLLEGPQCKGQHTPPQPTLLGGGTSGGLSRRPEQPGRSGQHSPPPGTNTRSSLDPLGPRALTPAGPL